MKKIKRSDFGKIVLFPKVKDNLVSCQFGIDAVPVTGYYVIRFWPFGREKRPHFDHPIGMINAGEDSPNGSTDWWEIPDVSKAKTINYQLDLDVWKNEDAYSQNRDAFRSSYTDEEHFGQQDRGGELQVRPPDHNGGGGGNGGGNGGGGKKKAECHQIFDERGEVIWSRTVWEDEPEFGTSPRRTRVTPGECQ